MSIESMMPSNHLILCSPFSSCPQSFPASGSFQMKKLVTSGGQSMGASASVLPVNIQGWFPLGLIDLLADQESSPALQFRSINSLVFSLLYGPTLTSVHDCWKDHRSWLYGPLSAKWCFSFLKHLRREWKITPVPLPWEAHELYKKAKRYDTKRWAPHPPTGQKVSNMLLGKRGEQLPRASERMKELGQSGARRSCL